MAGWKIPEPEVAGTVIKLNGVFFIAMFDYPRDHRHSGGREHKPTDCGYKPTYLPIVHYST